MHIDEKPIFVRGLSRSGGTLVVTVLDAHPEIAMSYELYPTLLEMENDSTETVEKYMKLFSKARNIKQVAKKIDNDMFKKFVLRCDRGGLDVNDLELIFREQLDENRGLETHQNRLELIAKCCRIKMHREGKTRWGLKCNNKYDEYLSIWPNAYFLNIIRDGRDVLSSQLRTGSFNTTPEKLGRGWASTHRAFKKIVNNPEVNAYEILYEKLVSEPASELEKIVGFLELNYEPDMLEYHNKDLTIYSASHLSMKRIAVGIDTSKVGRWKSELTDQQAQEFCDATNGLMQEYNYN
jgi:Sulfotransferase family